MSNNFQNNKKQEENSNIEKEIEKYINDLEKLFLHLRKENRHIFLSIIRDILNVNEEKSLEKLKSILETCEIYENKNESETIKKIIGTLSTLENLFIALKKKYNKKNKKNPVPKIIHRIWEIPIFIQINELKKILENFNLDNLDYEDLLIPGGYVECLAYKFKKTSTNQIRKIFETMKKIYRKKEKKYIYISYPLLAYAQGRKLMPEGLTEIFQLFLDNLERNFSERNLKKFENFLIGLLGYLKKYAE